MRVTIKSIAEAVGVSRGTVDRALNNRSGINHEIAEKIKKTAEEMGYRPNLAAKALVKTKVVKKIGIILNSEGNEFFDEVKRGIEDSLQDLCEFGLEYEWRTMKGYDDKREEELMEELEGLGISGLVMTPINSERIIRKIHEFHKKNIKVVAINSDVLNTERIAYVGCKHKKSGTVAAGLFGLMSQGREETVAIVTGSKLNLALERRERGFVETIEKDYPNIRIVDILGNDDSDELSYEVTERLLKEYPNLDGLCFLGAGVSGGIKAVPSHRNANFKVVTFDLIEAVKKGLSNNLIAATILQEPYKKGFDGVQIMGKYLLFQQMPKNEKNYTELSIITKYSM